MNPANSQLQKLILSLGLDDLILEEVLVLLKCLSTRNPMLVLLAELLFLILHFLSLSVQAIHLLIQLVDGLVLQRVIAIFGVQLLDQSLELLFLRLDINGVSF